MKNLKTYRHIRYINSFLRFHCEYENTTFNEHPPMWTVGPEVTFS